jgi:hypothetical protein
LVGSLLLDWEVAWLVDTAEDHGSMTARDLVFGVGDQVRAWGRFVTDPAGDWLDLARVHFGIKPPGWKSEWSIRLIGADAEAVPTDFAANRVPGHISVVGTWRDESIEVGAQSPEIPAREPIPDWTDPPLVEALLPDPEHLLRRAGGAFGGVDGEGVDLGELSASGGRP